MNTETKEQFMKEFLDSTPDEAANIFLMIKKELLPKMEKDFAIKKEQQAKLNMEITELDEFVKKYLISK